MPAQWFETGTVTEFKAVRNGEAFLIGETLINLALIERIAFGPVAESGQTTCRRSPLGSSAGSKAANRAAKSVGVSALVCVSLFEAVC